MTIRKEKENFKGIKLYNVKWKKRFGHKLVREQERLQ